MATQEARDATQDQPQTEKVKRKRKRHLKRKKAPGPIIPLLDEISSAIHPIEEVAATTPTDENVPLSGDILNPDELGDIPTSLSTSTEVDIKQPSPTAPQGVGAGEVTKVRLQQNFYPLE